MVFDTAWPRLHCVHLYHGSRQHFHAVANDVFGRAKRRLGAGVWIPLNVGKGTSTKL